MNDEEPVAHGELERSLKGVEESARLLRESVNNRIAWNQIGVAVAVVVAAFAVVVGGVSTREAQRAHRDLDARSVAACVNYNAQERRQAAAEKAEERARQAETSVALDRLLVLLHLSPADLSAIQAKHLRRYDATVDGAHLPRDCSPAGIRRYLAVPQ